MQDDVSRFFTMLGHPLRRGIIEYLGDRGYGGFTDLRAHLNVSTGTLYYQLDILRDLIEQDDERKYHLNEKGRFAHQLLLQSQERLMSSRHVKQNPTAASYATLWIMGWRLISHLYGMPKLAISVVALILFYGVWVTNLSGLYPLIFIYVDSLPLSQSYVPILFVSGYVLVNVFANLTSYFAYGAKEGMRQLLLGSAVSLIPSIAVPTVYVVARELQSPLTSFQSQVLMLIGIGYSLCFLTAAISLSKGLAAEKAALSASITLYACLGFTFILTTL